MARKRTKAQKKTANKKYTIDLLVNKFITEHNLVSDDSEYLYFQFKLATFLSNATLEELNQNTIHLYNLEFEIVNFQDLTTVEENNEFTSFVLITSKADLFLLNSCGDIRSCFALWPANQTDNRTFDYEHYVNLFLSLKTQNILTAVGNIEQSGSINRFTLRILLQKNAIFQDIVSFKRNLLQKNDTILWLMAFFCGYKHYSSHQSLPEKLSINQFYSSVYAEQQKKNFNDTSLAKLDRLIPTLRRYQESAVKWMLSREKDNKLQDHQILFVKHQFGNMELYYHKILGHFITQHVYNEYIAAFRPSFGGILADEMGLGKTVETLALILHNKKSENDEAAFNLFAKYKLFSFTSNPLFGTLQCDCGNVKGISIIEDKSIDSLLEMCSSGNYYLNEDLIKCLLCGNYQHLECSCYQIDEHDFPYLCSRCWPKIEPIESSCTLIVCPKFIHQQWVDEIEKHLTGVRVLQYKGIRTKEYIFPPQLAKYDIVLTTYDILRSEIDFTTSFEYGHLRHSKKYYSQISPMLCIKWWRLCFDEAQLVEGTFTRAAQMANLLDSTYRWAVTGTPIQKSVNDMFGLLYFIGEEPFCHKIFWNNSLYFPYCQGDIQPLIRAVGNCFWRTPKDVVSEEIGILKPIYSVNQLELNQIERDFYLREVSLCKGVIDAHLGHLDTNTKMSDLSVNVHTLLLSVAVKLRQICCHPIAVYTSIAAVRQYTSLQDVLCQMIQDIKYLCEKDHREKISAMNGAAAIAIQKHDFKLAIHTYKAALDSILKYEEYFRTDPTQQYHIYYNLAEIAELFGFAQINVNNEPFPPFNGSQLQKSDLNLKVIEQTNFELNQDDTKLRMSAKQIYEKYFFNEKLACITTEKYRLESINKCNEMHKNLKFDGKWFISILQVLSSFLSIEDIDAFLSRPQGMNLAVDAIACPTVSSMQLKLDLDL